MSTLTMSSVREIADPKVRALAMRVFKVARLAAEKATANLAEPAAYPLPADGRSLERVFSARLRSLKQPTQQIAIARVLPAVKAAPAARQRTYGDLAAVNLKSSVAVSQQVRALTFPPTLKIPPAYLQARVSVTAPIVNQSPCVSAAPLSNQRLECRIQMIRCVDETGGDFEEWIGGSDEIALGGVAIDAVGTTSKIDSFSVGDFDDGTVKDYQYGPKTFTTFDLLGGTEWPKSYFVTFALAEVDMGGFGDFLSSLVDAITPEVKQALLDALGAAIGAAIGGALGGVLGTIFGAIVGWVLGKLIEWLQSWWGDEVFDPVTEAIQVPTIDSRWEEGRPVSPRHTVTFKGHDGEYQLTYDWRVIGPEVEAYRSLRSFNFGDQYIRHRNFRAELSPIASNLDRRDASFKMSTGLYGANTVSFESLNFPGHYLRHRNFEVWLDRAADDELFRKDASFAFKMPGLLFGRIPGWVGFAYSSFESVNYPGFYLRHRDFKLYLEKYVEDGLFYADASFLPTEGRWWA